jgi:hypothetical protein
MCFIGNFKAYQALKSWLQRTDFPPKLSPASVLCVVGPSGIGKTYGVEHACQEVGVTLCRFDTNATGNFKEFFDVFQKKCASDITAQFGCIAREDMVFLIDSFETFSAVDRSFASSFAKMLQDGCGLPHVRILITGTSFDVKRELPSIVRLELYAPSETDIMLFIRSVSPHASMDTCVKVAEACNGNLSCALHMLHVSREERLDKGLALEDVFLQPTPHTIRRVFSQEPWIAPLRFHENSAEEWKHRKGAGAVKRTQYVALMRSMCVWDYMMRYFKTDGDMGVPLEVLAHSIPGCLGLLDRKVGAPSPQDDFTRVFSHLSLEKKNMVSMESAAYSTDGLHSFHQKLLDSCHQHSKREKRKLFLPSN